MAKDEEIKKYTLNAKIETVDEKPSFKNSVEKRCLVIANGYYEWQWLDPKGKAKQKYELRNCSHSQVCIRIGRIKTQVIKNTYTILITEANPLLAEIHNHKKDASSFKTGR